MANLFTHDLSQVTLVDVEQFLNLKAPPGSRIMEGTRLEFKRHVPQDLGWDVAGLANTYGGILLLGVENEEGKKNIPKSLPGTDLGNDPRARLTDRILASVHPRPDFEVQPITASDPQKSLGIIRVVAGTYPPYEFSQGATVGIPIRIVDTTRQATLQEIEALLKNRELAARDPEQVVEQYMKARDFYCSVEGGDPQRKQLERDPLFHKLVLSPRVPARLPLDLSFERSFGKLIREVYRGEQNFVRAQSGVTWEDEFNPYSHALQYQFRISGKAPSHRVWRVWSDGTLGFTANHSRIKTPEPAGNFALEALLFLRLTRRLFEEQGYFGPSVMVYQIACPSHQFSPEFPVADPSFSGMYDGVDGLYFDRPSPGQLTEATSVEDLTWDTLLEPEEVVATVLLDLFRSIAGARIEYGKLLGHVAQLSRSFP
jgi:hypothetical protein